jgi:hypothetical protein
MNENNKGFNVKLIKTMSELIKSPPTPPSCHMALDARRKCRRRRAFNECKVINQSAS